MMNSVPGSQAGVRRRYGQGRRALYGVIWAAWTAVLVIGGFAALSSGQFAGLLALALGALAGYYDFRIWTWQAKRLWFLIIW